jgi:hypothetical protein
MTAGETAYLTLVCGALIVFIVAVGYATWRTEGAPAWFRRGASRGSDADRGPATAARAQ